MKYLTLLFVLSFSIVSQVYAQTPEEILNIVDSIRAPAGTFTSDLKVTLKEKKEESEYTFSLRVKNKIKSLVIYRSPPKSEGRVLLMVGENMWIYMPGTRKPLRISPQQQVMGRVSNADVARVVFGLDYSVEKMSSDSWEGEKVLKMTLLKKTRGAAYHRIDLLLKEKDYKPIKAEFYTTSNRLLKTVNYLGYQEVLGKERPMVLEVHDAINKSHMTIMEYSRMKTEDTPDSWYQKSYMQRLR